jgi:hypothetical protein
LKNGTARQREKYVVTINEQPKGGKTMKLGQFITETLKELVEGVKGAQDHVAKAGGAVNPSGLTYLRPEMAQVQHKATTRIGQQIEFDIEIAAIEGKQKKGDAKVSVLSIGAGGQMQSGVENRSVNRIKFTLPVIFPKMEYTED